MSACVHACVNVSVCVYNNHLSIYLSIFELSSEAQTTC